MPNRSAGIVLKGFLAVADRVGPVQRHKNVGAGGGHGRIPLLGGQGDVITAIERPDGKAGLERLWLLIVLASAYTVSMVIIVAIARPNDHSVWTVTGVLLLLATEVTIAVMSWRDIYTFGGLMPWGRLPVAIRLVVATVLVAAAAVLWVPLVIIAPVVQIVRGFIDLPRARRARAALRPDIPPGSATGTADAALSGSQIADALASELAAVQGRIPAAMWTKVEAIRQTILEILPRAEELGPQELFLVRRTAVDYLPVALQTYLKLPEAYSRKQPIAAGKTAYEILDEDLDLLQGKLGEVSDAIHRQDSDALLAHSRFLEEKFRGSSLTLPTG